MTRKGNAENAKLNGEFAAHVNSFEKRLTSKIRRQSAKRAIRQEGS